MLCFASSASNMVTVEYGEAYVFIWTDFVLISMTLQCNESNMTAILIEVDQKLLLT